MSEARSLPRVHLDAEVTLQDETSGLRGRGRVSDITAEGIAVAADTRFESGALLSLEVLARADREAGTAGPLRARLEVLRVSEQGPPYEVAGRFLELSLP